MIYCYSCRYIQASIYVSKHSNSIFLIFYSDMNILYKEWKKVDSNIQGFVVCIWFVGKTPYIYHELQPKLNVQIHYVIWQNHLVLNFNFMKYRKEVKTPYLPLAYC